jgi:hypothetical protein
MSSTATETVSQLVSRLKGRAKAQEQREAILAELKCARDNSERELKALAQLRSEYGAAFAEVVTIDVEVLKRAGIPAQPQLVAAAEWLADLKKWEATHTQNLAWANDLPNDVPLAEITQRIVASATSAQLLRTRAEELTGQFAKL